MTYSGVLTKMKTQNGQPVQYYLDFESDFINVNQLLGKTLSLQFLKGIVMTVFTMCLKPRIG